MHRKIIRITLLLPFGLFYLLNACQTMQEVQTLDDTTSVAPTIDSVDLAEYFPDTLLNRFEKEVKAFQQQDSLTPPATAAALFVGSSSLRMWDSLQADMAPVPVINRGFGGSTLPEALYYFNQLVMPYRPKVIFLYAGENDLSMEEAAIAPPQVRETFEIFVNTVKAKLPDTEKIYFISIKPSVARWQLWPVMEETNRLIKAYADQEEQVYYVDITEKMMDGTEVKKDIFLQDNLHMNRKGYAMWVETIKPLLLEDFE